MSEKEISEILGIDRHLVWKALARLKNKGDAYAHKCHLYAKEIGHASNQKFWFRTTEEERREILRLPPLKDS